MASVSASTRIAAPVDSVFALFTDLENAPGRIKGIKRLEKLTPGPVGVGTRFRETRVFMGREATEEMEFTGFEPNRSYTVGCQSCGCVYSSVFRFEPDGNEATRVTMDFEGRPVTLTAKLMAPLGWLMKGTLRKCLQQDLEDLRAAAESATKTAV